MTTIDGLLGVPGRLAGLLRSPLVTSAALFGLAGIAFVVATLVYGRLLGHVEFGQAVLVIAICLSAIQAAPAGLVALVVRRDLAIRPALIVVASALGVVYGIAGVLVAAFVYGLRGPVLAVIGGTILIGSTALSSIAGLQRQHRFRQASLVSQAANLGLLCVAVLMMAGLARSPGAPVVGAAVALAAAGAVAWRSVLRGATGGAPLQWSLWRQGLGFSSLTLSAEVFAQIDRFLIPLLLGYDQLGIFAVVAAVALAPFRMLEMAALTTLGPRLRVAAIAQRGRLLLTDVVLLSLLTSIAGVFLLLIGHHICQYVMPDQSFDRALIVAVVASGFARVLVALAQGTVVAWASHEDVQWLQAQSWCSLAFSVVAAWYLSQFGLVGAIYGVSTGWLLKAGLTFIVTARYLQR
jgi:O-antigen/teichoic acid export membrane protein